MSISVAHMINGRRIYRQFDKLEYALRSFFSNYSRAYAIHLESAVYVKLVPGDKYWPEDCQETKGLAKCAPHAYVHHSHVLQCTEKDCDLCQEYRSFTYVVHVKSHAMRRTIVSCYTKDAFIRNYIEQIATKQHAVKAVNQIEAMWNAAENDVQVQDTSVNSA